MRHRKPTTPVRTEVPVAALRDLEAQISERSPMSDGVGKSGADLYRVTIEGSPFVLKYLDAERDWTLRAARVEGGASLELWRRGLLHRLPDSFEQPIVNVACGSREVGGPVVTALLMRDVGTWLIPADDSIIAIEHHRQFIDHMAEMHVRFWLAGPEIDIVSPRNRYLELSPTMAEQEAARGSIQLVPKLVAEGWPLFIDIAPDAARVVMPLLADPTPLINALAATPQTLVHANFKLDNLGVTPEHRTVIFDWESSGRGACTADLAWYLSINCRRLPESKEDTITYYRTALERHGIKTDSWWDRQIGLSLLGALLQFGWEKAFSGLDEELLWWQEHALAVAAQEWLRTG
jgi:hypothetical protein